MSILVTNMGEIVSESDGGGERNRLPVVHQGGGYVIRTPYYLEKFTLYETPSHFYLVGRDGEEVHWRVLRIDKSDQTELVIHEDPTIHTNRTCKRFLDDLEEGNKHLGGRKLVATCYGVLGFIRFLGPYYILLVTKRKEIGRICGHPIYAISEYKMIPIPSSPVWSCNSTNSEKENRYKKLLLLLDIRKGFFFSYSYPVIQSLQRNLLPESAGQSPGRKLFIWNEYLTRQIQDHLKNTLWTVALVHGFFQQAQLSNCGKTFSLTVIARRSIHFAGTRYQKRGVDKDGQAANEVEIEQLVCQENDGVCPYNVTSAVQIRASIPLFWTQKTSLLNPKPDIQLDNNGNEAAQLHFQNLRRRYGDPVVILNLIKQSEKKPKESLLNQAYHMAVEFINKDMPEKDHLQIVSLDLDAAFKKKCSNVLPVLKGYAADAHKSTALFSCQIPQPLIFNESNSFSHRWISNNSCVCSQQGILRTNCLDSLDRTNVAQYVYGLVALGHQLYTLKINDSEELDFNHPLAYQLMAMYEAMGDALAQQYGGSAAHSKILAKIRGQSESATTFREFFKSIQRHYSNLFLDADKQKAMDMFLGHFRPDEAESTPSKFKPYQDCNIGKQNVVYVKTKSKSMLKRSESDSKLLDNRSADMVNLIHFSEVSDSESDLSDFRLLLKRSQSNSFIYYESSPLLQGKISTSDFSSGSTKLLNDLDNQWFGSVHYGDPDEPVLRQA